MFEVCEQGRIYSSINLDIWRSHFSPTFKALRGVCFLTNRFIAVGAEGTVIYADSLTDFNLIQLPTGDWLESVASSGTRLAAVGDNGAIYFSTNGTSWQRTGNFTTWLRSVAHGGNKFVAVGESGFIASSPDGVIWTRDISPVTKNLNRVAWVNGRFVAAGDGGTVLTNDVLLGWRISAIGSTNDLFSLSGNGTSRLAGGDSDLRIDEGTGWINAITAPNDFPAPLWTYNSAVWDGALYFVVGPSGVMVEGFKTNSTGPTVWVTRNDPPRSWLWDAVHLNDIYCAVGIDATIMTSDNGARWDVESIPPGATNQYFLGVGGNTNVLVTVGTAGTILISPNIVTNILQTNEDNSVTIVPTSLYGVEWEQIATPTTRDLQGIAWGNGKFVASGGGGTILTSADGRTWTSGNSTVSTYLSSVAAFPGGFVAVGDGGKIVSSADGSNWTLRSSGTTNWIYKVRYAGNQLIAVGENGVVRTSSDGVTWNSMNLGGSGWINDVTYAAGSYFICGDNGLVFRSSGSGWAAVPSITTKSLYGLSTRGGQLVAVGLEGAILRTQVVPSIEPIRVIDFDRTSRGVLFLFDGEPDQTFRIQSSTDLVNWNDLDLVEITDASGTLIYELILPDGSANYFRARNEP